METITLTKTQAFWSFFSIVLSLLLIMVFAQTVVKSKPNWGYGAGYLVAGTLFPYFSYMTFFYNRTFVYV